MQRKTVESREENVADLTPMKIQDESLHSAKCRFESYIYGIGSQLKGLAFLLENQGQHHEDVSEEFAGLGAIVRELSEKALDVNAWWNPPKENKE